MSRSEAFRKAAHELLGDSKANIVFRTLDLVGVAEQEIKRYKDTAPELAGRYDAAFEHLQPTGEMVQMADRVYIAHVCELLDRITAGQLDLADGTLAECLCAASYISTQAPPTAKFEAVIAHCFRAVLPEKASLFDGVHESWSGQVDEDLGVMRRKLRVESRRLPRAA